MALTPDKFLMISATGIAEKASIGTSAGAGDAGKIPCVDTTGRLDSTFMPVGIGADTASVTASEALAAGDFVNIWDDTGAKVRKADASGGRAKQAHGFVLAAVDQAATAMVYFEGQNTQLSALTIGSTYFLSGSVPGGVTTTPPTTTAYIVQGLGTAISASTMNTSIDADPIVRV